MKLAKKRLKDQHDGVYVYWRGTPGITSPWNTNVVITSDYEVVEMDDDDQVSPRSEAVDEASISLALGMPIWFHGGTKIGKLPARVTDEKPDEQNCIRVKSALSPYTEYRTSVDNVTYRMSYNTLLPNGECVEGNIDTLPILADLDGFKITHRDEEGRRWLVPCSAPEKGICYAPRTVFKDVVKQWRPAGVRKDPSGKRRKRAAAKRAKSPEFILDGSDEDGVEDEEQEVTPSPELRTHALQEHGVEDEDEDEPFYDLNDDDSDDE